MPITSQQPQVDQSHPERTITFSEFQPRLGLPQSRVTIWRLEKQGKFPSRIRLSDRVVVWREREILDWIAQRQAGGR